MENLGIKTNNTNYLNDGWNLEVIRLLCARKRQEVIRSLLIAQTCLHSGWIIKIDKYL